MMLKSTASETWTTDLGLTLTFNRLRTTVNNSKNIIEV